MKLFQHPGWKKFISSCKRISLCHNSTRQLTVLMLLGIFLTTGMIGNIQAAAPPVPQIITANKVMVNGREAGYVCDSATAQAVLNEILEDAAATYGMETSTDCKLTFEETEIVPQELSTKDELVNSISKNSTILVDAYTIYVDDTPLGILKSQADALQLLDNVKMQYLSEEASLDDAEFQEDVKVISTPVPFYQVQSSEKVEAELKKEQETIEEYTIKEEDTYWSISLAHNIDVDTLMEMNPDKDPSKLRDGLVIRLSYPKSLLNVVTTEVMEYEKDIPYETETQKDSSMYTTQSKVVRNGQEGLKKVEASIKKVNGLETERQILSEEVIREPVNKIVAKGTKTAPSTVSRGSGRLRWPVSGTVTSKYGSRWGRQHKGIDIANSSGTPIYAAEPGKVTFSGSSGGYGNLVKIDHGGGLSTWYAHMSKRAVSSGESVSRGQLIGYVGSTGNSTGPHLHFEVRVNGGTKNPLNYLP